MAEVCQMEKLTKISRRAKCDFCGYCENDSLKYGPMYKLGNVRAHYYCVLLSNRLIQNGSDNEGLLGFLLSDITKELSRTKNILCTYCKQGSANISCAKKNCRRNFHLPCGLKFGTSHQFMDQFKSFCHVHQLCQHIPSKILRDASKTEAICCICHEKVLFNKKKTFLWAPCCRKTWYHRKCVQKLAHSAGYFFRCATCNNVKKFGDWMQKFGIFVPQQDASWELAPNAFEELLFRYSNCDAKECKCPKGRKTNTENTMWEIVLCNSCGSQGIHVACGNLKFVDREWECPGCQSITKKINSSSKAKGCLKTDEGSSKLFILTGVSQKKRRRGSEDIENSVLDKRKKVRTAVEEEEIEIDVVTIDNKNNEAFAEVADTEEVIKEVLNVGSREAKTVQGQDPQEKTEECCRKRSVSSVSWKSYALKWNFQEVSSHIFGTSLLFIEAKNLLKDINNAYGEVIVLSILKPGPLSYKLAVIGKVFGTTCNEKKKNPSEVELIELSDSDDDVKIVEETGNKTEEERSISILRYVEKSTCGKETWGKEGETCTSNNSSGTISMTEKAPLEELQTVDIASVLKMTRPVIDPVIRNPEMDVKETGNEVECFRNTFTSYLNPEEDANLYKAEANEEIVFLEMR